MCPRHLVPSQYPSSPSWDRRRLPSRLTFPRRPSRQQSLPATDSLSNLDIGLIIRGNKSAPVDSLDGAGRVISLWGGPRVLPWWHGHGPETINALYNSQVVSYTSGLFLRGDRGSSI